MSMLKGVFFVILALVFLSSAQAQTVQGVVTGTVVDSSGAVIAGADLTLTNEGTGVEQHEKSEANGDYRFALVPPGTYTLTARAPGFATKKIKRIIVNASQTVPVAVTLSIATSQTVVEVTTQENMVQTATSDVATTINQYSITSLPLISRDVFDLAFAAPATTQGMNFNPAAGGVRESGTTNMLNGADNNDNFSEGNYNVTPPLETVAEFTVLTNNMSAQYGHAAGALVTAIQKSGTNSIHGAAYEFNRNTDFNASDFFSNREAAPKPIFIRNQFGGEVDGPIVKNKTFFMGAFDRIDLHQGYTQVQAVPTPSELTAMETNAGPLATQYLTKLYAPLTSNTQCPAEAANFPTAVGYVGCVSIFDPQLSGQNTYVGRIDHNFSGNDRLSFTANVQRYNYNDKWGGGFPTTTQNIPYVDNEHYHNLALVETHVFSPSVVNELTIAHNRHYSVDQEGNGKSSSSEVIIQGASYGYITGPNGNSLGFGPYEGGLVEGFVQDRWQFQDNLGWTFGTHSFKFGGGFQYGILYRNWDLGSPGYYEFSNTTGPTPASVGDLCLGNLICNEAPGAPDSNFQNDFPWFQELSINPQTGGAANAYRHYIMKDENVFVNDDYKVSRRLTLNLGLRWERYGAPTEAHNEISQFTNLTCLSVQCITDARVGPVTSMWKTPTKDFGPRVGFAWDVFGDGKTAVRGGFAISYDRLFDNIWSNGAWNPPFYALIDHNATLGGVDIDYSIPPTPGPYTIGTIPEPVDLRTMDVHMKDSSVQSFYFGIERQLGRDFLWRESYQGSLGRHLSQLMDLNRYDGECYNATLTCTNPNPLYTAFNYRANNQNSNYNSLVSEFQKRFSKGFQFQFSFVWSKLMDEGSDLFSGSTLVGLYSIPYYLVTNSNPKLNYGPGSFDHTLNFKENFTWELPIFHDQHGFLGHVLGGWQLSSFYQGYSGHPLQVWNSRCAWAGDALDANGFPENIGGDYNLDGQCNDFPDFIGKSASSVYSGNSPANGIFIDNNEIGCGFPGSKSSAAAIAACNSYYGVTTPSTIFVNPPGTGIRYGDLGRDLFRGPWFNGIDGSLMKNIKMTERVKLQLRFDALNLINHPNFDGIVTDVNNGAFGKAQTLVGLLTSGGNSPGFYCSSCAPSRRLQLGGRITF